MLAEQFFDQLQNSNDKRTVLIQFYISLFGEQKINLYSTFGKLLKLYSAENIFFSVLECYDSTNFKPNEPYGLLSYICKRRLEKKMVINKPEDLTKYSGDLDKSVKRKLKIKGNPFED